MGLLKNQMEIAENEKALLEGMDLEHISYGWAFRISKAKYQNQEGRKLFE